MGQSDACFIILCKYDARVSGPARGHGPVRPSVRAVGGGRRAPGGGRRAAGAGRFAKSLWPLPPHPHPPTQTQTGTQTGTGTGTKPGFNTHTHTHTENCYPALREDKSNMPSALPQRKFQENCDLGPFLAQGAVQRQGGAPRSQGN